MKTVCLLVLFIVGFNKTLLCQNYHYFQTNGETPYGYDINKVNDSDNHRKILTPKANEVLSKTQSFPFPFRFNGNYFANYKVSDNGYITFNTASTISYKPDSTFSNQQVLKNAIIPFWYDFELKKLPYPNQDFTVKVFAYTSGKYPNRTHTIQYYGLSKSSDTLSAIITNAHVFAFAVVLHEGSEGRFDLIYNFFGKNNIDGLAGCSDNAGNFTLLNDQPIAFPVAPSSAVHNTIIYQFHPGKAPSKRLYNKENIIDNQYVFNVPVNIKSRISNLGTDTVFGINYVYTVNGKDTIKEYLDLRAGNQYLLPRGANTITITSGNPWLNGPAGSINAIKTIALLQIDSLDKDSFSNSKTSNILRILGLKPIARNVLMEISTGGWCGYCASAHLVAEAMKSNMGDRFIPVMHHFGDPMETPESNLVNQTFEKGYPYGIIDRKYFSGQSSGWKNIVNVEKVDSSNVKVKIVNKVFDETTRKITFTMNVRSFDYLYGKYRVGAIITEDNVRGNASPSQWSQNNFNSKQYGSTDSSNVLYFELRYMDGYLHQFVVLDLPLGAWGKENSLPGYIKPDDEFNIDVSYTLPPMTFVDYTSENNTRYCSTNDGPGKNEGMFKPLSVNLIGFVAEYDEEDVYKRTILNAASSKLLFDNSSVADVKKIQQLTIFPNPSGEAISLINPFANRSDCHLEITNICGKQELKIDVNKSENKLTLDISSLSTGIYFVKVYNENGGFIQKISVIPH